MGHRLSPTASSPGHPNNTVTIWIGAVAIASVIVLDPSGWFPFSIAKWAAVSTLAWGAVAVTLWRSDGQIDRTTVRLWAGLLTLIVVSAVAGVGGREVWSGTPIRHLGVLAWLIFASLFIVGQAGGASQWRGLAFLPAGLALGTYVLYEALFGAPVTYLTDSVRLGGPYGSAAYLGAASCVFVPITIGCAMEPAHPRRWRAASWLTVGLLSVAVIGAGSRGALVGLGVAAAVTGLIGSASAQRRRASLSAIGLAGFGVWAVAARLGVLDRATPATSRLDEWRLGLRTLTHGGITGFGPEGYRLVVTRFISRQYTLDYGESTSPDRAHNGLLDTALSSGIPAAVLYALLLATILVAAIRVMRAGSNVDVGLGAAIVAYIAQQQFLFPISEIDVLFWMVAGIVVARATRIDPSAGCRLALHHNLATKALTALAVAAMLLSGVYGIRNTAADRLSRQAIESDTTEIALAQAYRAVGLAPQDVRHRAVLADAYRRQGTLTGQRDALSTIADALTIAPGDPTLRREQARIATGLAVITGDHADRARAIGYWQALTADAPACARCYRGLALTLLDAGETESAKKALATAADLGDAVAIATIEQLDP